VTETEPVRVPMVVGLNVTLIVQLALGLTVVQVFVWLNEPVTAILLTIRTPRPVLVSFTVLALLVVNTTWSGKVRLVGVNVTAACVPTPVREVFCGLLAASSAMVTAAFLVPVAFGLKVTLMLQLPPAGMDVPQLFVSVKSCGLILAMLMPVIFRAEAPPLLVRVVTWGEPRVPTYWSPKFRSKGQT
jgi:hypothetical protein